MRTRRWERSERIAFSLERSTRKDAPAVWSNEGRKLEPRLNERGLRRLFLAAATAENDHADAGRGEHAAADVEDGGDARHRLRGIEVGFRLGRAHLVLALVGRVAFLALGHDARHDAADERRAADGGRDEPHGSEARTAAFAFVGFRGRLTLRGRRGGSCGSGRTAAELETMLERPTGRE